MDIRQTKGFYDLCVNVAEEDIQNLHSVLSKLYEYGVKTVAINTNLDESALRNKRKKKKEDENEMLQTTVPEIVDIDNLRRAFNGRLKIFKRITFFCSDSAKAYMLNHCPNFKKYDLYAFAPKTQNALQFACTQLNADIITLRPQPITFRLSKKLYEQAIERGIHFEIQYADLLRNEYRKQTIHYSHLFHVYGKSKNIILSSGSSNIRTIRNPYDLINLTSLLGLNEVKRKASISHQCKRLLLRAERRRRGKAAFIIEDREERTCTTNKDSKTTKNLEFQPNI